MATLITKSIATAPAWAGSTSYAVGNYRMNDSGKIYQVASITTGISAASGGPTGTGSGIVDGGVTWNFVLDPDYETISAWAAAIPANLVTADEAWKGECYNYGEFIISANISIGAGKTVDATRYIQLTTAAGHSFMDHASKLTNQLRYDQSKGVGIKTTTSGITMMTVAGSSTIVEKLQFFMDASSFGVLSLGIACTARNLIIETKADGISATAATTKCINVIVIDRASSTAKVAFAASTATFANCTAVRMSDLPAGGTGFSRASSTTPIAKNCAAFGFATAFSNHTLWDAASTHNASDSANVPGSTNQVSKTYANQFEGVTEAARDFRVKTGSDLVNGTRDQTNTNDLDIVGTSRSTTTPTIGVWEYAAPAAATAITITPPTPASGYVNIQSGFFTIAANGVLAAPVNVTVASTDVGDTVQTNPVVLPAGATPNAQFKITPDATTGSRNISITNDGGLSNPAAVAYTANAAPASSAGGDPFGGGPFS